MLVMTYHIASASVFVKALSDQADEQTSGEPPMEHFTASRRKQALCEMAIEHQSVSSLLSVLHLFRPTHFPAVLPSWVDGRRVASHNRK